MKLSAFLIAIAVGGAVAREINRCATPESVGALKTEYNKEWLREFMNVTFELRTIDTYVHVVTSKAKRDEYYIGQVEQQMEVLNSKYSPMDIQFTMISVDFTCNDTWAKAFIGEEEEKEMKSALRQGSYSDLNLYLISDLMDDVHGYGTLGYCWPPYPFPNKTEIMLDGCVIDADTMPAGKSSWFDKGYTAVHEVGHWFGLLHPFTTGNCYDSGDEVDDTPAQLTKTDGCPIGKDSCPDQPGVDSIHNFMDYSFDDCLTNFTFGQMKRARASFEMCRAGK